MLKETDKYCKEVFDKVSELVETDNFYIAGGVIRDFVENLPLESLQDPSLAPVNNGYKDIDVFFNSGKDYAESVMRLLKKGFVATKERQNSTVLEKGQETIDLVHTDFLDAEDLINGFDFTMCSAAYGKDGLTVHPRFFTDVVDRKIEVNCVKLPYHTIMRVGKFISRGYDIDIETKLQIFDYACKASWGPDKEAEYNA